MTVVDEGVIKFRAVHQKRALDTRVFADIACELVAWRAILAHTNLVGQDPARYGGAGYGNVSARVAPLCEVGRGRRRFLITGTQTGGLSCVGLREFCLVERYVIERNEVTSVGEIMPSSESMTHGMIYDLAPQVRYVFHAHAPLIWRRTRQMGLPTTRPDVAYGTPEMAREVERLYRETALAERRIFAMGGHEDGIVSFGRSAEEAGDVLVRTLAHAYAAVCASQGVVCTAPGS